MESLKFHLLLAFVLVAHTLLQSHPVLSSYEYGLMDGINKYRQTKLVPVLSENPQAKCLAGKLSKQLKINPCNTCTSYRRLAVPANGSGQSPPFISPDSLLSKCKISVDHAGEAVILPACVPDPYPRTWVLTNYTELIVTNYTQTPYVRYLNDSKFTGFGAHRQDDWMVVVLSTDTREGDLASAAVGLVLEMRLGVYLGALLLGVVSLVLTS